MPSFELMPSFGRKRWQEEKGVKQKKKEQKKKVSSTIYECG